jgi:hypothetical protein
MVVISWTSQRDNERHAAANLVQGENPGYLWESAGPPEQTLIFDTLRDREVCGLHLRCSGTKADPKDVTLKRSFSKDGPWVIVRRIYVNAGSKNRETVKHEFLFDPGGASRYWKFDINQNWGAATHVSISAPLTFLAKPLDENEEYITESDLSTWDLGFFKHAVNLTVYFDESLALSHEDREVRSMARNCDIPLDYAERVYDEFRRYASKRADSDRLALMYDGFSRLLHAMITRSAANFSTSTQCDVSFDIPESRVHHMWHEVQQDTSGYVHFQSFLVWFYQMFHCSPVAAVSPHSHRQANTVTERFYAGLGRERLRKIVQMFMNKHESEVAKTQ